MIVLANGYFASGSQDNSIIIWNLDNGAIIKTLKGHTKPILDLITLDNGYLVSSSDEVVKIWNPIEGSQIHELLTSQTRYICEYMTPLPKAHFICSIGYNYRLSLIDAKEGTVIKTVVVSTEPGERPEGLATLNNGELFANCMQSTNKVMVWRADDLTLVKTISRISCFYYLTALKDGNLAVGGADKLVKILYMASEGGV